MASNYKLIQQQELRRHSFPPQKNINVLPPMNKSSRMSSHRSTTVIDDNIITVLGSSPIPLDLNKYNNNVYPLTEENLAIHAKDFQPCKDARRRNARLFVENQRPLVEMELILEEQREQEISSFIPNDLIFADTKEGDTNKFCNFFGDEKQQNKKSWIKQLTHWIRLDSIMVGKEKRRYLSWSAGTEKENAKHHAIVGEDSSEIICQQERDSGISILNHHHNQNGKCRSSTSIMRSSRISSIPIARQPKFSPTQEQHDDLITFKYPKMVRRAALNTSNQAEDSANNNDYALFSHERLKSSLDINHSSIIAA